ncbi:MAG TPA: hypothetical protein DEO70_00680 [Bacteroidales bacterium]|nr:MAG: hypothetical protein A2X11_04815 [Bacteroidetes bacterium GWE2_42_24]OFY30777.1 MAG: hypothetical protein A2X09_16910 [Bacteroidetes bacterium GWF2_43_11]PKP23893.1 MAG: hypothetical protein CVU06_05975 [Bacteroidetes bacterium HGW-Bacteroidetes-22]HBZ65323.1 hypothetical protein [Bacteroidales bacterium]
MLTNDNKRAFAGTLFFHGLILLALLYFGFSTPLPLPGEEGVEVNLGYSDEGFGLIQPREQPAAQSASTPSASDPGKLVTSDDPESVALENQGKRPENKNNSDIKKNQENQKPAEPVVNANALYKGKGSGSSSANQGIAGGEGDQGRPNGDPNSSSYTGTGKGNGGVSFNLAGRGKVYLNEPPYNSPEQGKVVVEIIVDRLGNVIRANPGVKGTTTSDLELRRVAKEAALKSKFTPDPNAVEEQKGHITYNFIRLN